MSAPNDAWVVWDGKEGPHFDCVIMSYYSPDGQHILYEASRGAQHAIVHDTRPGRWYDAVMFHYFSPDGRHIAYDGKHNGQWHAVWDGKEGRGYDQIYYPTMAPDSRGQAYAGGEHIVDVQGYVDGPDSVLNRKPDAHWHVVVNGQESPAYDEVGYPIRYSPDGAHLVYPARKGTTWMMVTDGKAGPAFDKVEEPVYDSTGRLLVYLGQRQALWYPVVNGVVGTAIEGTLTLGKTTRELLTDPYHAYGFDRSGAFYFVMKQPGATPETACFVRYAVRVQ